jgi:hypothetical protein
MWTRLTGLAIVVALFMGATLLSEARPSAPTQAEKKDKAPKPDKKLVKELMARKLEHSQKLLAALVTNDLNKAAKEAEELQLVRKEAAWLIVRTDEYDMWSKEFAASADGIIKAAKDKNLDAAKLRYLEMTTTCFHCHAYVRDLGDISAPGSEQ